MALFVENEVFINAAPEVVWQILIDPESTKKYMFGCEVQCTWKIGDPITWKGADDGVVYVKGELVEFTPPAKFGFTVFDPNATYDDIPRNYLTASYTLTPLDQGTKLQVSQGDYATVDEGNQRYEHTLAQGGWQAVLEAIKELIEKP